MPYKHEYEYKKKLQEKEPYASVKALTRIFPHIRLSFELYSGILEMMPALRMVYSTAR